jgi:hypothetical protein
MHFRQWERREFITLLGGVAVRHTCAVDNAANSRDDSELAADRDGAREAYRPDGPKASVSIKRCLG